MVHLPCHALPGLPDQFDTVLNVNLYGVHCVVVRTGTTGA